MLLRFILPFLMFITVYSSCDFGVEPSSEPNMEPTAVFKVVGQSDERSYLFDSSDSSDPEDAYKDLEFYWDFGDDQTSSLPSPFHQYAQSGTYNISLKVTDQNNKSNIETRELVVSDPVPENLAPEAWFVVKLQMDARTYQFDSSMSSDPEDDALTYLWDFGDGQTSVDSDPIHEYLNDGLYEIKLTVMDEHGSSSVETMDLNVNIVDQAPVATFDVSALAGVRAFNFDASHSSDPNDQQLSYFWVLNNDNSQIISEEMIFDHTFTTDGTHLMTLTVTNESNISHTYSLSMDVTSNKRPIASFIVLVQPEERNFYFDSTTSSDPEGEQLSYLWDFGDGMTSIEANPYYQYEQGGDYIVLLTVTDSQGATHTMQRQLNVMNDNQAPTVDFEFVEELRVVNLDASASMDEDGDSLTYTWDFGDLSPVQTSNFSFIEYTYEAPGEYVINLTVDDGNLLDNLATVSKTITITNNEPTPLIGHVKTGLSVEFVSIGTDIDGDELSYFWDFGDGQTSTLKNVTHVYSQATIFEVSLTVNDSFGMDQSATVMVDLTQNAANVAPTISALLTKQGYTVTIDASNSVDSDNDALSFSWDLGNTETIDDSNNISYTYDQQGTYLIQLTVSDGQGNDSYWSQEVVIELESLTYEQLSLKVSEDVVSDLNCNACHDESFDALELNISSTSDLQLGIFNYFENDPNNDLLLKGKPNGDYNHLGGAPLAIYPEKRDYWFEYVDQTKLLWLGRNIEPQANFVVDVIAGLNVLVDASTSIDENPEDILSYQWSFADQTATGVSPILTFEAAGTYDVTLLVSDGELSNSFTMPVTVALQEPENTPPTVLFSTSSNYLSVEFDATDSRDNDAGDDLSFIWTINSQEFTQSVVAYEFDAAGTYNYSIQVSDGTDISTQSGMITVEAAPIINYPPVARITTQSNLLTVSFSGLTSSDPDNDQLEYLWTVNNETFTTPQFDYTFPEAGSYLVQLTVTDSIDQSHDTSVMLEVSDANLAPTAVLALSLTGYDLVLNGSASTDPEEKTLTYQYQVDGSSYDGAVAIHTLSQTGLVTVTLTVTDDLGLTDTVIETLDVTEFNSAPTASFSFETNGLIATFDASGSSDVDNDSLEYFWQYSGQNKTGVSISHTFSFANTYAVKLTVRDEHGLEDTITRNVSVAVPVNYTPTASFIANVTFMDVSLDATMSSDVDGTIERFTWSIENETFNGDTLEHTFSNEGTYTITLEVEDDYGAVDTYSEEVSVSEDPDAQEPDDNVAPIPSIYSDVQFGQYIHFNGGNSIDPEREEISFIWTLSNGDVFNGADFFYEVPTASEITATLTVFDGSLFASSDVTLTPTSGVIDRSYDLEMFEMASKTSCASSCHSGSHPFNERENMSDWDDNFRDLISDNGTTWLYEFPTGQTGSHDGGNAVGSSNWEKWQNLIRLVDADINAASNQPPVAEFDVSVTGDTVTMINNSSDPENATLSYTWAFGNVTSSTDINPTHTYAVSGQYVIKLTVSDGFTVKHFSKLVDVNF